MEPQYPPPRSLWPHYRLEETIHPSPAVGQYSDDGTTSGELRALDCNLSFHSDDFEMEGFSAGNFSEVMGSAYRLILSRSSNFRNMLLVRGSVNGLSQKTKHLGSQASSGINGSNAMLLLLLVVLLITRVADGQQAYVDNHQLDCYNQRFNETTLGYVCNGLNTSCQSYLTFRTSPLYNTPVYIGYLLAAAAPEIASLNNLSSEFSSIPADTLVVVPVNCSCSGRRYYQHEATYKLKSHDETYFTVANNTYQGLTTCQSLMSQNPFNDRQLAVNETLRVPLRCACPTANQTRTTAAAATTTRYLLTYIVTWGDSISYIAELFGVDQQSILDANQLSSESVIFPFTPLLVPLSGEPNTSFLLRSPPAAPPPVPPLTPTDQTGQIPSAGGSSRKKWVFVGVGTSLALLLVIATLLAVKFARRKKQSPPIHSSTTAMEEETKGNKGTPPPQWETESGSAWSLSQGIKNSVEALTLYKFHDLEVATDHFSEANRIKGSVYKGSINGDAAAVKVMKGDLSASPEINILKTISHSNIIRLSGFCVNDGTTYLVYEYAENGALSDWIFLGPSKTKQQQLLLLQREKLTWKQRVQIANDVAEAINYLHSYADPPYIHKNLKTSNILLDADLRGKVTNFGLARAAAFEENENGDGGASPLTRHVVGTYGYMAPEYVENGLITPKLDVFAFGVVLLELLSGKEAASRDELLFTMINTVLEGDNVREKLRAFIDPSLADNNEYPLDLAFSMAQLAKGCVSVDLNARPSMPQVFMILSKILSSSLDWDPSHELHQSSSVSGSIRSGR
ncbi:unnamed protein product [Linum tenue]|uniref:Uncharacterized protein n=1 Tax=Linum tenue TaxID=586396 RepID=A0AAV0P9C6_9ROSI|nr:unnamed protein product [Linum tenue]